MQGFLSFWETSLGGFITVGELIIVCAAIFAGLLGKILITAVLSRVSKAADRTATTIDDAVVNALTPPLSWGAVLAGFYIALDVVPLPQEPINIEAFIKALGQGSVAALAMWFALRLSDRLFGVWENKAKGSSAKMETQVAMLLRRTAKATIVILGGSLVLQNMGYSVTGLLAGLGLGGAALALASKDTLANIFGAMVIFVDRPFTVGDWVEVGDVEGTVEEVGLRTTRVRTFANSLITLPNAQLTTTHINNWSRMEKRRISMHIGLTYSTTPGQMEQAVEAIRKTIREDENIHSDFFLVNFDKFGPSSLDIFIYCFTKRVEWAEFLKAKEKLMLSIMREMDGLGLSFAFPTQTLHIESMPSQMAQATKGHGAAEVRP